MPDTPMSECLRTWGVWCQDDLTDGHHCVHEWGHTPAPHRCSCGAEIPFHMEDTAGLLREAADALERLTNAILTREHWQSFNVCACSLPWPCPQLQAVQPGVEPAELAPHRLPPGAGVVTGQPDTGECRCAFCWEVDQ